MNRFCLPFFACLLVSLLGGCHRPPPQTAAELQDRLPHRFIGEIRWQGETQGQRLRIETRELAPRDEHLLAFNGVRVYLMDPQGGILSEHAPGVRGTISAPGLEIRIEELGSIGGEGLFKPGSFSGKLSNDLQSVEGAWKSEYGGSGGKLQLKAEDR
jgi:hypothetical protein